VGDPPCGIEAHLKEIVEHPVLEQFYQAVALGRLLQPVNSFDSLTGFPCRFEHPLEGHFRHEKEPPDSNGWDLAAARRLVRRIATDAQCGAGFRDSHRFALDPLARFVSHSLVSRSDLRQKVVRVIDHAYTSRSLTVKKLAC
jgi:hypothetical protein